jgi:hypothetical protein
MSANIEYNLKQLILEYIRLIQLPELTEEEEESLNSILILAKTDYLLQAYINVAKKHYPTN